MTDFAFLHGGGQGSWVWDETIAAMQALAGDAVRCLALDAPGCGRKRGRDTSAIAFADTTRELIADIEAAGYSDVVLVGHSQAGMTMPQMIEFAPGLFARAIFVTCSAPLPGMTTLEQMGHGVRHGESLDHVGYPVGPEATMAERYRIMFASDMDDAAADAFLAKVGADQWPASSYAYADWKRDHLAALPVSYIVCEADMALPAAWQEVFAARLHADRVVRIDAGHQAMNSQPDALARLLLAEAAG